MRQCMDSDNLHRRLKKIIGQVQAIDRMIDEDIAGVEFIGINTDKQALRRDPFPDQCCKIRFKRLR